MGDTRHDGHDETRVASPPREMPAATDEAPKRGRTRGAYPFDFATDDESTSGRFTARIAAGLAAPIRVTTGRRRGR